jgi:hypothetical protein
MGLVVASRRGLQGAVLVKRMRTRPTAAGAVLAEKRMRTKTRRKGRTGSVLVAAIRDLQLATDAKKRMRKRRTMKRTKEGRMMRTRTATILAKKAMMERTKRVRLRSTGSWDWVSLVRLLGERWGRVKHVAMVEDGQSNRDWRTEREVVPSLLARDRAQGVPEGLGRRDDHGWAAIRARSSAH